VKILIVHEVNYLSKIIYEFQILPEILSILGHEITIVDFNDSWRSESNGQRFALKTAIHRNIHRAYPQAAVTVHRPGMVRFPIVSRLSGAVTAPIEIVRIMRHHKPDVVLLYGLPTIGVQTILAGRLFKIPVVFRAIDVSHQLVPNAPLVPIAKVLEKIVFNSVAMNIALTPHLKQYISSYGVPESRIRLLCSGVDAELFSPGERDAEALARWGIGPRDRVVLFMGTIYKFSGLDRVIEDLPALLDRHPTAKLLIVGVGEDEQRLQALARSRRVAANIVFTGLQPYAALPALIRSADVCINPFELNGITENILPTKLFQYMTCAKPVLATKLPGTLVFLPGEDQGIVYATLADFTMKLSDLLSDKNKREVLGRRALQTAKEYDWRSIAQTLANWLGEVA
jgi:glycosyltransferase involved in cell wall biosynthesis